MKATGELLFTRHEDGSITHEWTDGRRIAITGRLLAELTGSRKRNGDTITLNGLQLRIVGRDFTLSGQGQAYSDTYIAMREGWLARIVAWYVRQAQEWALPLFQWECSFLGKPMLDGQDIPKWSLTGLLCRWL